MKVVVAAVVLLTAAVATVTLLRSRSESEGERAEEAATRVAALCEPIACRVVALERIREDVWRARVVEDHPEGDHVTCIVLPLGELRTTSSGGITGWRDVRCASG